MLQAGIETGWGRASGVSGVPESATLIRGEQKKRRAWQATLELVVEYLEAQRCIGQQGPVEIDLEAAARNPSTVQWARDAGLARCSNGTGRRDAPPKLVIDGFIQTTSLSSPKRIPATLPQLLRSQRRRLADPTKLIEFHGLPVTLLFVSFHANWPTGSAHRLAECLPLALP